MSTRQQHIPPAPLLVEDPSLLGTTPRANAVRPVAWFTRLAQRPDNIPNCQSAYARGGLVVLALLHTRQRMTISEIRDLLVAWGTEKALGPGIRSGQASAVSLRRALFALRICGIVDAAYLRRVGPGRPPMVFWLPMIDQLPDLIPVQQVVSDVQLLPKQQAERWQADRRDSVGTKERVRATVRSHQIRRALGPRITGTGEGEDDTG